MSGVRLVRHFPNTLSNLGWCLWSAGMLAAYSAMCDRSEDPSASPGERYMARHFVMQPLARRIAECLPECTEWRLEGPPEAVAQAWDHLQSIGVAEKMS
jgi:hypothetical protein